MLLRTGYFARGRQYGELGYMTCSISASSPTGFQGAYWSEVAPSWDILNAYKKGNLSWEKYKKEYRLFLESQQGIYDKLTSLIKMAEDNGNAGVIFLCWEKLCFHCHRSVFADYLNSHYSLDICELEVHKLNRHW